MNQGRPIFVSASPGQLLRMLSWRGILGLAIGATLLVALFLLMGVVFLVAFPIILLVFGVARFMAGWRGRAAPAPGARRPDVIEGDYVVIEQDRQR